MAHSTHLFRTPLLSKLSLFVPLKKDFVDYLKLKEYADCRTVKGIKHHLGVFATAEEAHNAYKAFKSPYLPS